MTEQPVLPTNVLRRLLRSAGHRSALRINADSIFELSLEDLDCIIKTAVLHTYAKQSTRLNVNAVEFAMRENGVEIVDSVKRKKTSRKKATNSKETPEKKEEEDKEKEEEERERAEEEKKETKNESTVVADDDLDSF